MRKITTKKRIPHPNHVLSVKRGNTTITYDKEADAMYFRLKTGKVARTVKMQDWLLADVDHQGVLLGVEMLFVSLNLRRKGIDETIRGAVPVPVSALSTFDFLADEPDLYSEKNIRVRYR